MSLNLIERMDRLPLTSIHRHMWIVCTTAWLFDGFCQSTPAYLVASSFTPLGLNIATSALDLSAAGFGLLLGSVTLAYLGDALGRRTVFQIDLLTFSLGMFISVFATNWWELFATIFISNLGVGGMYTVDNAYIAEFFPPRSRGRWQAWMTAMSPFGGMLPPLLFLSIPLWPAWVGWRIVPAVVVIPSLLVFLVRRVLPESPRFLISRGKVREAEAIVQKLEASAGPQYKYDGPIIVPQVLRRAKANPTIFFWKKYRMVTLVFWSGWFAGSAFTVANYLPTIFTQGLGGAAVGTVLTVLVSELIMVGSLIWRVFATTTIDKIGRRGNMMLNMTICGSAALAWSYPFTHRSQVPFWELIVPGMFNQSSIGWNTAFFVAGTEVYPIEARAMAYGWSSSWGRFASTINPFIVAFLLVGGNLTPIFYAGAAAAFAVAALSYAFVPRNLVRSNIEASSQESVYDVKTTQQEQPSGRQQPNA